jgi:hypothetical protein
MKTFLVLGVAACLALTGASAALASSQSKISGDYLETRSADVYTGFCVANSEVNLSGDQAILAWKIREGSWNGVSLANLSVVGVAKASATLGDPFSNPYPAKAVLIVDDRATEEQRAALQAFAQSMAKDLLKNIVKVETAPISLDLGQGEHHGYAKMAAGDLAEVETRSIHGKDHLCGNEEVYYQPLTELQHAMPAFTLNDEFNGKGLGVNWKLNGKRSAFLGHFSHDVPATVISRK